MATQVTVRGASARHVVLLNSADTKIAGAFPASQFYMTIGRCHRQRHAFPKHDLLEAARSLLRDVQQQWAVLPYRYSLKLRVGGRDDLRSSGSGASGFHINGRVHAIWSGAGRCYLDEMQVGPDGRGKVVRKVDVRHQKRVDTDDWGPIEISRRKLELTLPRQLQDLIAFLSDIPDADVQVLSTDGPVSVMDLVRLASEDDEGAEEELFNMGDTARRELLKRIADGKTRKYHGTIAWILQTVFPSPQSREAVERLVERERDPERKKTYLAMLASARG